MLGADVWVMVCVGNRCAVFSSVESDLSELLARPVVGSLITLHAEDPLLSIAQKQRYLKPSWRGPDDYSRSKKRQRLIDQLST